MGAFRAILELEEKQMDVLFSSVEFSRKTDNKGRPVTSVFGGRIKVTIESTQDTSIIESMLNNQFKPINGSIIYKKTDEDSRLKQILFHNSYIVYYKEICKSNNEKPMNILVTYMVERFYTQIKEYRDLVRYFTNKNISISYLRAKKKGNTAKVLALYGTSNERNW